MGDPVTNALRAAKENQEEAIAPEGFSNMFPQLNLSRNCMILIVLLLFVFLFKEDIMNNKMVKSLSKSLK